MAKSFVNLIKSVIDSYMESFETAFPAVVKKVNGDGTVDVTPSVRNTLKNMQIEPDGEDGKPLAIEGVPVMWPGTAEAIVKCELSAGDPLLCIASSRDLREWIDGGEAKGPYSPKSFSGNDLNDIIAIPMSRGGNKKVVFDISHDGKVEVSADSFTIDGELEVTGDVKIMTKTAGITLSSHIHPTSFGPTLPPKPDGGT